MKQLLSDDGRRAKNVAAQKRFAEAHPDRVKATQRKKYLTRRDELLARAKTYRENNKEKIKIYFKKYRMSARGKIVLTNAEHRRRAKKRGSDSRATNAEIKALLNDAKNCIYCHIRFDEKTKPTLDHVVPLAKGGQHSMGNLAVACGTCNSRKKDKLITEFT